MEDLIKSNLKKILIVVFLLGLYFMVIDQNIAATLLYIKYGFYQKGIAEMMVPASIYTIFVGLIMSRIHLKITDPDNIIFKSNEEKALIFSNERNTNYQDELDKLEEADERFRNNLSHEDPMDSMPAGREYGNYNYI